jgi:hypothetical protein
MVERQRGKLLASAIEKLTAANHQAACAQSDQVRENCIDVSFGGGIQNIAHTRVSTPFEGIRDRLLAGQALLQDPIK